MRDETPDFREVRLGVAIDGIAGGGGGVTVLGAGWEPIDFAFAGCFKLLLALLPRRGEAFVGDRRGGLGRGVDSASLQISLSSSGFSF